LSIQQRQDIEDLKRRVEALERSPSVKDPEGEITHADIDAMLAPVTDVGAMTSRPVLSLKKSKRG
jgi:hypothetical protein